MGDIFSALAAIYGYNTLKSLFMANAGLIFILGALLCVCLLFWKLLDRQFPRSGRDPVKTWIFKTIILFGISAFIFVCAFTVFYEKKKMEESRREKPAFSDVYGSSRKNPGTSRQPVSLGSSPRCGELQLNQA